MRVSLKVTDPALSAFLPDDSELGPAMKAIPERHRLFVVACLDMGSRVNHAKAAQAAGYALGKPGQATLRVRGHRLAHDPKIQAAIREESLNRIYAGTSAAASLLVETVGKSRVDIRTRLKAATAILDRAGMGAMTEHKVTVDHKDSRTEKILKLAAYCKATGQDPKQFLGDLVDVTDADFEMIENVPRGE